MMKIGYNESTKDYEIILINSFKAQYKMYLYTFKLLQNDYAKLKALDDEVSGIRSPSISDVHYNAPNRDEKLADYAFKRGALVKQIEQREGIVAEVEGVISFMPKSYAEVMCKVYSGARTYEQLSYELGYGKNQLCRKVDQAILEACKMYYV